MKTTITTHKICPFCKGKVIYTKMNKEVRQPEFIMCIGDCNFEIMNDDYKHSGKIKHYYEQLEEKQYES